MIQTDTQLNSLCNDKHLQSIKTLWVCVFALLRHQNDLSRNKWKVPWRLNVSVELVTVFKGGCEIKGVSFDYSDLTCDFFSLFKKNKPKCKYMDLHNFTLTKL